MRNIYYILSVFTVVALSCILFPSCGKDDSVEDSIENPVGTPDQQSSGGADNGHTYVDLGLRDENGKAIYWATCNVGANRPEDFGLYFAWGETQGYGQNANDGRIFEWEDYKWRNGINAPFTKYCTNSKFGSVDNKITLDAEDDAAHIVWGGKWRMPTEKEMVLFGKNCKFLFSTKNGVAGYLATGPNGNSIFLPLSGYRSHESLQGEGLLGYYWTSSVAEIFMAKCLYFEGNLKIIHTGERYFGCSIRAVRQQ